MSMSSSRSVAYLGSGSSHGGVIISASGKCTVNGKPAAVTGDLHSCPIKDHGVTALSSSSPNTTGGKALITVGDVAGCGAVITTGSLNVLSV